MITNYNLFLDDIRVPNQCNYMRQEIYFNVEWIIVRNYNDFIRTIELNGIPKIISFDHDLADIHYIKQVFDYNDEYIEKSGYHCAKWLIDYCIDNNLELPENILVHSMNPIGSINIKSAFDTYNKVYNKKHSEILIIPFIH